MLTTLGVYIFSLSVSSTISLRFFSANLAFFRRTHGGVFDDPASFESSYNLIFKTDSKK